MHPVGKLVLGAVASSVREFCVRVRDFSGALFALRRIAFKQCETTRNITYEQAKLRERAAVQ